MQHKEREAENPERMLGPQLTLVHVHIQALGESPDGRRGELGGLRVDVGQVVTRLVELAAAVKYQAAARPRARRQRRGEAGLRQREADADVSPARVPVDRIDADVYRLVGIGEGADPAADHHAVGQSGDGIDPAAHPVLRLPLAHRHAGLAERPGQQGPVEQVTGPHP
jgi:hypothetical protein